MEIVLARHGETEWSRDGRHTGRTDIPLTEEGRRAGAAARATRSPESEFARVLSARSRARSRPAGWPASATRRETHRRPARVGLRRVRGDHHAPRSARRAPAGSSGATAAPAARRPADVGARVDRVIAESLEASGDVALFAHGHVLRVLAARWIGLRAGRRGAARARHRPRCRCSAGSARRAWSGAGTAAGFSA